jgi:predicted DNA binding CopG/RHH family protein
MNREPKPIDSPKDIPAGLSDEERMAFLEEHGVSEYFLENVEEASEEERPRPRTRPINVRFDEFTLGRLKALAGSRNVGYQTLLKTFVQERLTKRKSEPGQRRPRKLQSSSRRRRVPAIGSMRCTNT